MTDLEKQLELVVERVVRRVLAERDAKPANDTAEYLSVKEAAAHARVSVYSIRRWVRQGELTKHTAGSKLLVKRDELDKLLACDVVSIEKNLSPEEWAKRRFG